MVDRLDFLWKGLCLFLAVLLVVQVARLGARRPTVQEASLGVSSESTGIAEDAPPSAEGDTNSPAQAVPGRTPPSLNPAVQSRVDRIVASELLGRVQRPLPMALLGIAGSDAFLRAPNGMTGLVREGNELGGIKLIRIGTNRVLIEHEGQNKELTVFSGFGGENLMPAPQESPK